MFCTNCGKEMIDGVTKCPNCGKGIGNSSPASSVDLQSMKNKTSSVIYVLRNLDKRKTLYATIISLVLVILFGYMTVNALNPAKKVKAEVTYASEPYTNYSTGTFYQDTYYQRVSITYKGKEYTGIREIGLYNPYGTLDTSCHVGSKITAYIVNGKLTLDKGTAKVSIIGAGFSILLLMGSIGSCGWFALQYLKRR